MTEGVWGTACVTLKPKVDTPLFGATAAAASL